MGSAQFVIDSMHVGFQVRLVLLPGHIPLVNTKHLT